MTLPPLRWTEGGTHSGKAGPVRLGRQPAIFDKQFFAKKLQLA